MSNKECLEVLNTKLKKERAIKAIKDLKEAEARILDKIKKRMEELSKDPTLAKEFDTELERMEK